MASRLISTFDQTSDFAESWPYSQVDMSRVDNSNDAIFYDTPRFVTHIDDRAIESLTAFYKEEMSEIAKRKNNQPVDVLDLCSSWISHLPTDDDVPLGNVVGIGMNQNELAANKQLTSYTVQDLNQNPMLDSYPNEGFDVVCNVVSVDYLTQPLQVFQETHRVLRPGGVALISFSNRCFPTKAVSVWLREDDIGRLGIVGSYFHYAAKWERIEALDVKLPPAEMPPRPSVKEIFGNPSSAFAWASTAGAVAKMNSGDPLFVVKGVK